MPSTSSPAEARARTELDDPIKAEYDVFITPRLGAQLYLLQHPNVSPNEPYIAEHNRQPAAMRIKPKSGFLEMEVSVSTSRFFNKEKGIKFGQDLRKAKAEGSASFGLANGFSGPKSGRGRNTTAPLIGAESASRAPEPTLEDLMDDFEGAESRGQVLNKMTIGGQIARKTSGKPIYMLGSFRGNELHLSPLDGVAQMRPQFHHVDAQWQLDRNAARREREAADPPRQTEPRAVQMSFKPTGDDAQHVGTTDALLKAAQEETWTRLKHHDESAPESWNFYEKGLHVEDIENAPELISSMKNEQYLDAISAPRPELSARNKKKAGPRREA
ncbi:MAG: hypothetical protein M1822_003936 [Bathelium mastoideum]|nr:MAG: hypothetical protein M1822_003936 [Bathelium mastoideum]